MVCRAELAITCILNQLTQHQMLWEALSKGSSQVHTRDGKLSTPQVTTSLRKIGWQRFQTGATRGWWRKRTLRGMVSCTLELQTRWVLLETLAQCNGLVSSLLDVYGHTHRRIYLQLCSYAVSHTSLSSCSFYITFAIYHFRLHQSLLHPVVLSHLIGFSEYSGPFIISGLFL